MLQFYGKCWELRAEGQRSGDPRNGRIAVQNFVIFCVVYRILSNVLSFLGVSQDYRCWVNMHLKHIFSHFFDQRKKLLSLHPGCENKSGCQSNQLLSNICVQDLFRNPGV